MGHPLETRRCLHAQPKWCYPIDPICEDLQRGDQSDRRCDPRMLQMLPANAQLGGVRFQKVHSMAARQGYAVKVQYLEE